MNQQSEMTTDRAYCPLGLFLLYKTKNEVYPHPDAVRRDWALPWIHVIEKENNKKQSQEIFKRCSRNKTFLQNAILSVIQG